MADKKKMQGFLKDVEKRLKGWGGKAKEIAKGIEKDAVYGGKVSKVKLEEIELEAKRWKLYRDLGKQTHDLLRVKKIKNASLNKTSEKISDIDSQLRKKKALLKRYKTHFAKPSKTPGRRRAK